VIVELGGGGDILERAVALVAIEGDAAEAEGEEIGVAVVVVVGGGGAEIVVAAGDAGFGGDVRELEIAVVAEERIGGFGAVGEGAAVGEEEIEAAVVVVVEDGDAAGCGGGKRLLNGLAGNEDGAQGGDRPVTGEGEEQQIKG
jgi:hypothetical protein